MPEQRINEPALRSAARMVGWLQTCWLLTTGIVIMADHRAVTSEQSQMLFAIPGRHYLAGGVLVALGAVLAVGNLRHQPRIVMLACTGAGTICLFAAMMFAITAYQYPESSDVTIANWAFIGCLFFLNAVIMRDSTRKTRL